MPIDPEKGFHVGTAVSCILGITGQSIYNCLLLPVLPSMIKLYFPGVYDWKCLLRNRLTWVISVFILDISSPPTIWVRSLELFSGVGTRINMVAEMQCWLSVSVRFEYLIIIIVNIVCVSGLGISQNYYLSVIIRLIHGLADGLLGVTKTILTEMSNEKNVSLGTSFLFIGAAIGRIIGPLMSGYLTNAEFINFVAAKIPILKKVCQKSSKYNNKSNV